MEEAGLEWNSALTAAVTMATEEGIKKESEEISGTFLYSSGPSEGSSLVDHKAGLSVTSGGFPQKHK